jgi:hypothetical protein
VSCRTGPLRVGRPLRGVCTGLAGDNSGGLPLVGDDVPDQREGPRVGVGWTIKKACERPPSAQEARPAGHSSVCAKVCVDVIDV